MYLLKRADGVEPTMIEKFTFHHVSIKTIKPYVNNDSVYHSHSTMYLLKLAIRPHLYLYHAFTFHHVSIKTVLPQQRGGRASGFTFHHVSIKTRVRGVIKSAGKEFTFHHVSIKTKISKSFIQHVFIIHIPPCIY